MFEAIRLKSDTALMSEIIGAQLRARNRLSVKPRVPNSFTEGNSEGFREQAKKTKIRFTGYSEPLAAQVHHGGFVLWRTYPFQSGRSPSGFARPALSAAP